MFTSNVIDFYAFQKSRRWKQIEILKGKKKTKRKFLSATKIPQFQSGIPDLS